MNDAARAAMLRSSTSPPNANMNSSIPAITATAAANVVVEILSLI
jgi:hypothetical protein